MYHEINETAARRAKEANSYNNYKTGSKTAEYRAMVDAAKEIAEKQKRRVDPMHHDKIDRLLAAYCAKLAENFNKGFEIDARVPSVMIAGPSNFPNQKKAKQNAARDRNMAEYRDIQGLLDKIKGVGKGGISADDPNAIGKLKEKLESLERSQATMKAVNAYYRKHGTLDGCPDLQPDIIEKLKVNMARDWRQNPRPFESWVLSNNSAEIRRLKKRIEDLTKHAEKPFEGWDFEGGKVVINKEINRLQIFFDEKPNKDLRAELSKNGFKCAPSQNFAWQRQLTSNAMFAAKRIKAVAPTTEPAIAYEAVRSDEPVSVIDTIRQHKAQSNAESCQSQQDIQPKKKNNQPEL